MAVCSIVNLKDEYQKKIDGLYELAKKQNIKVVDSCLLQTGDVILFAIEVKIGKANVLSIYPVGKKNDVLKTEQEICLN